MTTSRGGLFISGLERDLNDCRLEHLHQVVGMDADQIAATATVYVNDGLRQDALLDEDRHRLLGAKRTGAADQEASVPIGDLWFAGLYLLATGLPGQLLGGHLAIAVHQHDEWLGVLVLHDQRFHDGVLVDVQFPRRDLGPAVLFVGVEVA